MLSNAIPSSSPELLACPVCRGPLTERASRIRCRTCALHYVRKDGVYLLGPPFAANPAPPSFATERMRRLLEESVALGWEEARQRFTSEVLSGRLRAPERSRLARMRARLSGTTWEDTLQDLVDPTRGGWKFLLDLHPEARVLFLGPTWGAALLTLARSCAQVVVLDGALERLQLCQQQARGAGITNLVFGRVMDPLRLPLTDGSVDLVVVPGLAEWFQAIAATRPVGASCGTDLLCELRRVLAPDGQVYLATDHRHGLAGLLGERRLRGARFSPRGLRRAAHTAGFAGAGLFAPVPFRHKFHQVVDLERTDRMNFCLDPYRTRGRAVRPLVKAWDALNRGARLERRLYAALPGVAAVLSTGPARPSLAERILLHLASKGLVAQSARTISRYYVRPKGVAVLTAGHPGDGGVVVRLPLDDRAEAACRTHHTALESMTTDARIPAAVRALFPTPLAQGTFEGQPFFAEAGLAGELGRVYYSRSARRYDRAILSAAEALRQLRRATEERVVIDEAEFDRLCGRWMTELREYVGLPSRPAFDQMVRWLHQTLLGATLPLGWYHGDYDFANLLYGAGDRLTGILDFEIWDARGLPLVDLVLLLARRPIRKESFAFGALFLKSIFTHDLPPMEAEVLATEMRTTGVDERLYRAIALCCWLNHLRLRRDSWLVRSPSWLDANLHSVVEKVRSML